MLQTPGVASAVSNRGLTQLGGQLGGINARYGIERLKFNEDRRRWEAEQEWKRKMLAESKSAADKAFWNNILGAGLGAAGAIGGALIGGPLGAGLGYKAGEEASGFFTS